MKKRLISMLLALALLCACLPQFALPVNAATSGYCGKQVGDMAVAGTNLRWSFDASTGKLTITGSGDMTNWEPYYQLELPEWFPKSDIKSVSLPNGLTSIGDNAFSGCSGLTSITLPDSVTSIGEWAFLGCENLKTINLGNSLENIGWDAFRNCTSLKSITIPSSVKKIGNGGKSNEVFCSSLKDVYYCGTKEQWNKISVANENEPLLKANIHFNSTGPESYLSYIYNSGKPVTVLNKAFEDYVFSEPSTSYNPELAFYLCALSRAAYSKSDIEKSLKSIGFSKNNIQFSEGYKTDNHEHAAYSMAKKSISDGTLVLITIRGTNTDRDKLTDAGMGVGTTLVQGKHEGFMGTVNDIVSKLNSFIGKDNIGSNERFTYVITGHSLGAAVGNLLAVELSDLGVPKNRVFDYNIACPDVAKKFPSDWNPGGEHDNIYNICNSNDIVTKLPGAPANILLPGAKVLFTWGKFGQTKWITAEYDGLDAHDAETYLRYLSSYTLNLKDETKIVFTDDCTFIVFRCPVDVTVYNSKGNPVAGIIDNKGQYYDPEQTEVVIFTNDDQKAILLPKNQVFDVSISGTGKGKMTYEVYDLNLGKRTYSQSKIFDSVTLNSAKEMYSEVSGSISVPDVKLFVVDKKGTPVAEVREDGKEVPVTNPFFDVKKGSFYYDAVLWAVNHAPQITNGIDATHFGPDVGCTRGQVVTFLWRAAGCPEPTSKKNPFRDVKQGAFYYKAVLWAVDKGITKGTSATTFSPNDTCTRGQIVTFLHRFKGSSKAVTASNPFKDVSKTAFYYPAMLWAVEYGVTNGTSKTAFSPGATCTRGQVVTFLYRASRE